MEETEGVETTAAVTPIEFEVDRSTVTCYVAIKEGGQKVGEVSFSSPSLFANQGGLTIGELGARAVQQARAQWEQQQQ